MSDATIFNFNHIDLSIGKNKIDKLKALYKHYHKKWWCSRKTFKRFK